MEGAAHQEADLMATEAVLEHAEAAHLDDGEELSDDDEAEALAAEVAEAEAALAKAKEARAVADVQNAPEGNGAVETPQSAAIEQEQKQKVLATPHRAGRAEQQSAATAAASIAGGEREQPEAVSTPHRAGRAEQQSAAAATGGAGVGAAVRVAAARMGQLSAAMHKVPGGAAPLLRGAVGGATSMLGSLAGGKRGVNPHVGTPPPVSIQSASRSPAAPPATPGTMDASHLSHAGGGGGGGADDHALRCCKFHSEADNVMKEMLFVPANVAVTPRKVATIVRDHWKAPHPNMIVNLDAGSCHPTRLATKLLRDRPQFEGWIKQAREQLVKRRESYRMCADDDDSSEEGAEGEGKESGSGARDYLTAREPRDVASSLINDLLYQKMLEAFSAIVESACMSNNWILFDRTRLDGASSTAELLLELAIERTKLRPVVIVVDSAERLQQCHHEVAAAHADLINKCFDDAASIADENAHAAFTEHFTGSTYSTSDFSNWKQHSVYGKYTNQLSDLPAKAAEHHKEQAWDGTPIISRDRVWSYFYKMSLFNKGSHYVFLGNMHSRFPVEALAPTGSVCAHGSCGMYPRLRDMIHRGLPTVMLYNSGGVAHSFASVHNAIMNPPPDKLTDAELEKQAHKSDRVAARLVPRESDITHKAREAERILKLVEVVSTDPWARSFGIPEIMKLTQVHMQEPRLFKKTVVVADLVHDTPEDMLAIVSGCFANTDMVSLELGHGNANLKVTYEAWKRHLSLWENSRVLHMRANILELLIIVLSLITGALSVVFSALPKPCPTEVGMLPKMLEQCPALSPGHGMTAKQIKQGMVILPIVSALLLTVQGSLRWRDKAAACDYGAVCIVSEIYKFRAKVCG